MPTSEQAEPTLKDSTNPAPSRDLAHTWIIAATVAVDEKIAKQADFRGSWIVKAGTRINALETYCSGCRRQIEDVLGADCEAKINNEHLIGGDQSVRVKRKTFQLPPGVVTTPVPAPRINRRGIDAYIRGEI